MGLFYFEPLKFKKMIKQIQIFTDCVDANASARQQTKWLSLFPGSQIFIHKIASEHEGGFTIVDLLDVGTNVPQIIVVQAAPREEKKYENGRPFCFVKVGELIIIGTPGVFYLLRKLGITTEIFETDVCTVCLQFLPKDQAEKIANSQFRSLEYVPFLAKWISEGKTIPGESKEILCEESARVVFADCFGNCKTSAITIDEFKKFGEMPYYERLADVPRNGSAVTRGSSGYAGKNFLEIVVQGGSAREYLGLGIGDIV